MGRNEREVMFEHAVKAWTVGDLRKALEGVADDVRLVIETAERPGGDVAGPTQVVISGGYVTDSGTDAKRCSTFQLATEFPSGTYYKIVYQ